MAEGEGFEGRGWSAAVSRTGWLCLPTGEVKLMLPDTRGPVSRNSPHKASKGLSTVGAQKGN